MKSLIKLGTILGLAVLSPVSSLPGQIDFDRPDLIKTSFAREMAAKFEEDEKKSEATTSAPAPVTADIGSSVSACSDCGGYQMSGYPAAFGSAPGLNNYGCGCDQGLWGSGAFSSTSYCGGDGCENGGSGDSWFGNRNLGLMVSGIVDIPMDGVFLTHASGQVGAGVLGPAAVDLEFDEFGFEEVYGVFGGVETNVTMALDCNTRMFLGYRYMKGEARQTLVGSAIGDPMGAATPYDINATFSDYEESRIQMGFLTNNCLSSKLDLLWGGRIGIGFVDDISANFDVTGLGGLNNVRLYDDTTNLAFGFNFGIQRKISCRLTAHALTGIEYRTSLKEDNPQLATYGLENLNDGSGFASLPVYLGFSFAR